MKIKAGLSGNGGPAFFFIKKTVKVLTVFYDMNLFNLAKVI